jgi:hypothetical protein
MKFEQEFLLISALMVNSIKALLGKSKVIVISNRLNEFLKISEYLKLTQKIMGLIRLFKSGDFLDDQYESLVG